MLATVPTCLVGLMYILSSVPHCLATKNKEFGEDKICCGSRGGATRHWTESAIFSKEKSFKQKCTEFIEGTARGNKTGQFVVCCIWILLHIILAVQRLIEMLITYRCSMFMRGNKMWDVQDPNFINECCEKPGAWDRLLDPVELDQAGIYEGGENVLKSCGPDPLDPYAMNFRGLTDKQSSNPKLRVEVSVWVAVAKVFGQLLNLNCSIVLVPVVRLFLRFLSNKLLNERGKIAGVIPVQKNITFHKAIAKTILVLAAIHTVSHFMGIADKPAPYYDNLQLSPWITGYIIIFSQFFYISGS